MITYIDKKSVTDAKTRKTSRITYIANIKTSKLKAGSDINMAVGEVLRQLRVNHGLSQSAVAKAIGLTFQQIQKYERGSNKVSLINLILLSDYFRVPVTTFTDPASSVYHSTPPILLSVEPRPTSRIHLELGREINSVTDESMLRPILALLRVMNRAT